MPSDMVFRTAFGSWGNGLRAAGFEPVKFLPTRNGKTRLGTRNQERRVLVNNNGYAQVFEPSHSMAMRNGYVLLHRKMAYDAGILTDRSMEINHINRDKLDNRMDNFEVLTKVDHAKITTPIGTKRPRHGSKPCTTCGDLNASKYGLCRKHYKLEWQRKRDGLTSSIGVRFENPELLEPQS